MKKTKRSRTARGEKKVPRILIFDVDGVLVDVRATYGRTALQAVQHLSGKRVTYKQLHAWKHKPGYNDDWRMTADWATSLGRPTTYEQARAVFERLYWGTNGHGSGNVRNEKIVVTPRQMERWARHFELNIFTGRTRREFEFTFDRWAGAAHFRKTVTMDDVPRPKPDPAGLLQILDGRDPQEALFLGDNVDDALAARGAGVPFLAILDRGVDGYRGRAARFHELGAVGLLHRTTELNHWLGSCD